VAREEVLYVDDIEWLHYPLYAEWFLPPTVYVLHGNRLLNPTVFKFDTRHNARVRRRRLDLKVGWRKSVSEYVAGMRFPGLINPDNMVELAACGVAFLVIGHVTGHRVTDFAKQKGEGYDYCLDEGRYALEVSGTVRRRLVHQRWFARAERIREYLARGPRTADGNTVEGGYVMICCFDSTAPGGRFSFHPRFEE